MASHLAGYFELCAYDPAVKVSNELRLVSLGEALKTDVIVLAIPAQHHEEFWQEAGKLVNPNALLVDVSSVKVKPLQLMAECAPDSCQIVGIHPMFGPQSGKDGITGLNAALIAERISDEHLAVIRHFLSDDLGLRVHEMTAEEHDEEMAYVQALTFFIGKGLGKLAIPKERLTTATYQHLLDIKRIVSDDSDELYRSIQTENTFAANVREEFVKALLDIEQLEKSKD